MSGDLAYVVVDLETTGLDEHTGLILEIAAVGLDEQLQEIFRYSTPITQFDADWTTQMPDVVLDMHTGSGLLADVLAASSPLQHPLLDETDDQGFYIHPFIETADDLLASVIDLFAGDEKPELAGSGVSHMDFRWMKHHMPKTAAKFWHGTIDVGCMRRWYKRIVGDDLTDADSHKTHRALDDVNCHLEELGEFGSLFVRDVMLRDHLFATEQEGVTS